MNGIKRHIFLLLLLLTYVHSSPHLVFVLFCMCFVLFTFSQFPHPYPPSPSLSYTHIHNIQTFFIFFRIILGWESFNFLNMVGFIIFSLINFFGLKGLFYYLSLGHPRSSYSLLEECLWVSWFIQVMSVFTGYAWFLFLAIPGYLFFAYKDTIMSFINARKGQQPPMQQTVPMPKRH